MATLRTLRLAFRTLLRTPFVTLVAVLSLALGIGANAAIYSLFEQLLQRPLPVHEPDRLVNLKAPGPVQGAYSCNQAGCDGDVMSLPMFRDLAQARTGLSGLAGHRTFEANLAFRGHTLSTSAVLVSGSYFPLLGLRPALGRLFGPPDDEISDGHPVAVLGHSYWVNELGGATDVLNQSIIVNGVTMTIVGVAPEGFEGTTLGVQPRAYVPISMASAMLSDFPDVEGRTSYWVYVFGRLSPGVTVEQARDAINTVYSGIINEVELPLQTLLSEEMLVQFRAKQIDLHDGRRGQSSIHQEVRTPLLLLFGIAGVVLLIACANIANLLLARGAGRRMEISVRLSLGASRNQVVSQLLTESLVLALLGGVVSLYVAWGTLALVGSIVPAESTEALHLGLRWPVVLFAAAVAIGTGLLFGLFPAIHSTRADLVTGIRANAGQIAGARSAARFRSGLVTVQIALSMMLLISAGLFLRSLSNLSRVELGLTADRIVTFGISPARNGYEHERSLLLFQRAEEELAALPGVASVAAARLPVLAGFSWGSDVSVEGFQRGSGVDANSALNQVGPGYFATLGIPLLAGRDFNMTDRAEAPRVAIVNQAFVEKFGLGADPLGKRMGFGSGGDLEVEIVGVVRDARYNEVRAAVPPIVYTPYLQGDEVGSMVFHVRTAGDPRAVMRSIPGVIAGLDPNLPVEGLKSMPQQIRENVSMERLMSILSASFATLATLLAAIGLYGVLAYTVAQRTREIGVRMALGAGTQRIRSMVLRQVVRMLIAGGIIGIASALGLGRAAGSLLYGLQAYDPLVLVAAVVLLAAVALGAGYLPARRASRVDPIQALRYE